MFTACEIVLFVFRLLFVIIFPSCYPLLKSKIVLLQLFAKSSSLIANVIRPFTPREICNQVLRMRLICNSYMILGSCNGLRGGSLNNESAEPNYGSLYLRQLVYLRVS